MIKKLFDWTPRDIAYWEKIQNKGLWKFIIWYGIAITGGLLFLIFALMTIFIWLRQSIGSGITSARLVFIAGQLAFVLIVCLVFGVINSLITWVVEQRLYRKYKKGL